MSYTKTVDFQAKDALASGNPSKIIKGTEIDDEFDAIQVADALNLKRDGTTAASADIPMGAHKFTNLAAGTTAGDSVRYEQFASPPAIGNTTPAAVTGTTVTATTQFSGPGTGLTGTAASLSVGGTAADIAGGALGSVPYQSASGATEFLAAGSQGLAVVSGGAAAPVYAIPVLRGYIDGLTLSTAGASATMSIAAGVASDSSNVYVMNLSSAISKTTSSWAVGTASGGLDTGVIANSTWYYFFLIRRPDTGVVDVVFSATSASPTLPTNYTQYRYIGAGLTNGSAQWTKFIQKGSEFYWDTPVLDFSAAGSVTAALLTCSVPLGRNMKALLSAEVWVGGAGNGGVYISSPDVSDAAPSMTVAPLGSVLIYGAVAGDRAGAQVSCWTNTSAQVRHREIDTSPIYIATLGWEDLRGKNA